jgi:hypothetical protein
MLYAPMTPGPVAQRLEQRTHNPLVESSNLSGPIFIRSIAIHSTALEPSRVADISPL